MLRQTLNHLFQSYSKKNHVCCTKLINVFTLIGFNNFSYKHLKCLNTRKLIIFKNNVLNRYGLFLLLVSPEFLTYSNFKTAPMVRRRVLYFLENLTSDQVLNTIFIWVSFRINYFSKTMIHRWFRIWNNIKLCA